MEKLNFPPFDHQIKIQQGEHFIFDTVRKKYLKLLPEEWVRQHVIHYLITYKEVPSGLIEIEKALILNTLKKRADIVINNNLGDPIGIIECKAPNIKITQETAEQISRYNLTFKVPFLLLTNGLQHFAYKVNHQSKSHTPLASIPDYNTLCNFMEEIS